MVGGTTILCLIALGATMAGAHRHHELAKAHHHLRHHRRHFARAPAPAPAPSWAPGAPPAEAACEELCKSDEGLDKRTCMTECRVHTDATVPEGTMDDGLTEFVHDEVHNEQVNGSQMVGTFEKMSGVDAREFECIPTVNPEDITFDDVDLNGDGGITKVEAYAFGDKMCEPNERVNDLFNMADVNADGKISRDEFEHRGENQVIEKGIDETLDKLAPGEDEYAECSLPPFEKFDKDHDGFLHEWELADAFMFEMDRRAGFGVDTITDPHMKEVLSGLKDKIMEAVTVKFKLVDTNGDGKISPEEWDAKSKNSEDFGDQFEEQADQDEDDAGTDIDDLASVDPPAAPAPAFLQRHAVSQDAQRAALNTLCQMWSKGLKYV